MGADVDKLVIHHSWSAATGGMTLLDQRETDNAMSCATALEQCVNSTIIARALLESRGTPANSSAVTHG